jgi:hypothetical protein
MLVKVYESDSRKEKDNGLPAYHYEVLNSAKTAKTSHRQDFHNQNSSRRLTW